MESALHWRAKWAIASMNYITLPAFQVDKDVTIAAHEHFMIVTASVDDMRFGPVRPDVVVLPFGWGKVPGLEYLLIEARVTHPADPTRHALAGFPVLEVDVRGISMSLRDKEFKNAVSDPFRWRWVVHYLTNGKVYDWMYAG